jgi:hypothetical protein
MAIRKALLVGINSYPVKPLRGCINDVKQMNDLLKSFFGFAEIDIRKLLDKDATMSSIETGLEWLAQGGPDSDAVRVFHFSGHGSYKADQNGDEPDGRDECLVPVDFQTTGFLTDDALKVLYDSFPRAGNLTLIMDSCHSGSVQKDIEQDILFKFLPIPQEEQERIAIAAKKFSIDRREFVYKEINTLRGQDLPDDELHKKVTYLIDLFEKSRFGDIRVRDANILLAACKSDQSSADAYISGDYHGAFTYFLCEAIYEANGQITYRDLAKQTDQKLYGGGFLQVPQLECRGRRNQRLAFQPFI